MLKQLIDFFRFWELKRVVRKRSFTLLDLGCGEGNFVRLARKMGIKAVGVDQNPPPNYTQKLFIKSTIEKLHFNKKFDVVSLFHVLEHFANPKKVLLKTKGFLKKDGILVIEVPLVDNLTAKFLGKDYFAYQDKTHRRFFSKKEIINLINESGLKIKRKGLTFFEFPLTVLTTSFKKGLLKGLGGLIFFFPLKILSLLGINEEIIRLYCQKK